MADQAEYLTDKFQEAINENRAQRAFSGLELHPVISRAVTKLFEDGHYASAVENACKALEDLVKTKSGLDLSGTALMQTALSPKNPVLEVRDFQTEPERRGLMYLFAGAMLAVRNPRAHSLIQDDAESALDRIAFVNFLAKTLDRARKSSFGGGADPGALEEAI